MQPDIQLWNDFLPDANSLYHYLENNVSWDTSMRARKTASFGAPYNYSQMSYPAQPFPPQLSSLLQPIKAKIGFEPNNCLLNFYPDGNATMGFHSDSLEELDAGTGVAILSLGDVRSLTFRSKQDKSLETAYRLENGSLFYMPAAVQNEWLHAILKQENTGGRMSLTFRQLKT